MIAFVRYLGVALVCGLLLSEGVAAQTLSGLFSSGGKPAKRIRLYVSGIKKPISTDSTGRFSVTVPGPGTYTVTPYPNAARLVATPFRRTVVVPASGLSNVNFEIGTLSTRTAVRGRILDRAGVPQSGVEVYISGFGGVESDANGIYGVSDLPPGRHSLTAFEDAFTFIPAVRTRTISAGRAARISIRAVPLSAGPAVATFISGVFDAEFAIASGSCPLLPARAEGRAVVLQRDRTVRFYLPRLGFAALQPTSSGFGGAFSQRKLGCRIDGEVTAEYASPDDAAVTGSLKVVCLGAAQCEGTFAGTLTRQ